MNLAATLIIGFSVVAALVLYTTYVFFLHNVNKSPPALVTSALLLLGLSFIQLGHLDYINTGADPLASFSYRFWLFMTPSMFYLFSRSILFEEARFTGLTLLHVVPVLLVFIEPVEISIPILFCIGTGYSVWLTQVIYSLRNSRSRSTYELFFLGVFTVMAIAVLILGFCLPYMQASYFYYAYAFGIGLALILVVGVLLSFPHLLAELAEAAKLSYAASTLNDVDVVDVKRRLEQAMERDKVYYNEALSLTSLAEVVQLNAHQLSELINSQFKMSFSRYIREHRVHEAQRLLKEEPDASILSISMQVGFKSQSNFYAAFKEITGSSPGSYRNT